MRVLIALVVVVLLLIAYGFGALFYASSRIDREPVGDLGGGGAYTVLVTGSDSRENLTDEQRSELTTGGAVGARTDTIFLMTVRGGRAAMLAFPRDLFVTLCDGSQQRINAATTVGGKDCLVETVTAASGITIDHTIAIDFLGFSDVVDAVGGVDLCLEQPLDDPKAGVDLPAGCQRLGGSDALGFVRSRDNPQGDLGRIQQQQQFLQALAMQVAQPATVLNPLRFYSTAGAMGAALTADDGFSSIDIVRLGIAARGVANGQIVTETVPTTPTTVGGAAVLDIVQPEADQVFERFQSGAVLDDATAEAEAVAPEDVDVAVRNGSGVEGLARRTAEALTARGFTVTDVDNAPETSRTIVRHPAGLDAEAATVAAEAPGGSDIEVEQSDDVDVVTLILGSDVRP